MFSELGLSGNRRRGGMNEQRGIVFDPLHQALAPYTAKGLVCSGRRGSNQKASEALIKRADHLAELFDFDAEVGMQEAVVPDLDEGNSLAEFGGGYEEL